MAKEKTEDGREMCFFLKKKKKEEDEYRLLGSGPGKNNWSILKKGREVYGRRRKIIEVCHQGTQRRHKGTSKQGARDRKRRNSKMKRDREECQENVQTQLRRTRRYSSDHSTRPDPRRSMVSPPAWPREEVEEETRRPKDEEDGQGRKKERRASAIGKI